MYAILHYSNLASNSVKGKKESFICFIFILPLKDKQHTFGSQHVRACVRSKFPHYKKRFEEKEIPGPEGKRTRPNNNNNSNNYVNNK